MILISYKKQQTNLEGVVAHGRASSILAFGTI